MLNNSLKKYRLAKGYTQRQLAKALDMSYSTLTQWECGALHRAAAEDVARMASFLDTTVEELLTQ